MFFEVVFLFLSSGGVPYEEEVLVFDFFDLIGNIGGFLGLCLGASILSMFDEGKRITDRLLQKFSKK